jgi:hypothetical protein
MNYTVGFSTSDPFAPRCLESGSRLDHPSPIHPEGLAALRPLAAPQEVPIIGSLFSRRPLAPLPKSFRINADTKLPQNAPLSNPFKINYFQTSRKAPLSKSFRIIWLSKTGRGRVARILRPDGLYREGGIPNSQCFLSLTKNDKNRSRIPQCFQSLADQPSRTPQKSPNVFYHLQTISRVSTCVFYHFLKKAGGEGWPLHKSSSVAGDFSHFGTTSLGAQRDRS